MLKGYQHWHLDAGATRAHHCPSPACLWKKKKRLAYAEMGLICRLLFILCGFELPSSRGPSNAGATLTTIDLVLWQHNRAPSVAWNVSVFVSFFFWFRPRTIRWNGAGGGLHNKSQGERYRPYSDQDKYWFGNARNARQYRNSMGEKKTNPQQQQRITGWTYQSHDTKERTLRF